MDEKQPIDLKVENLFNLKAITSNPIKFTSCNSSTVFQIPSVTVFSSDAISEKKNHLNFSSVPAAKAEFISRKTYEEKKKIVSD